MPYKIIETIATFAPASGNCWCSADRAVTIKGPHQDGYDLACRNFHKCMRCNSLIDETCEPYSQNIRGTYDTPRYALVASTTLLTFQEYTCYPAQDSTCAENVCACYTKFMEDLEAMFLAEVDSTTGIYSSSYNLVCANTAPIPGAYFTDSCCGSAPNFTPFNSNLESCDANSGLVYDPNQQGVCNGNLYSLSQFACCGNAQLYDPTSEEYCTGDNRIKNIGYCNVCTCAHGVAKGNINDGSTELCSTDGAEECSSCDTGYSLTNLDTCQIVERFCGSSNSGSFDLVTLNSDQAPTQSILLKILLVARAC